MSTKNTPKKNGSVVNAASSQQAREEEILLTQVHKLQEDQRGGVRFEAQKPQAEDDSRPSERPAGHLNPDEPSDSVQGGSASGSDDSGSAASTDSQNFFGAMMASQLSIVLTGAQVTLDESSGLQNALTTSVVGDSNDNDIATGNLPVALVERLSVLVSTMPIEAARSGFDGVTGQPLVEINADASVQPMALTNSMGHALTGEDSGLFTLAGQHVFLFTDTQDPHLVLGKTGAGQVVMAVYLSPTTTNPHAADVWTVLYQPLQHPESSAPDEAVNLAGKLFVTAETTGGSNMLVSGPSGQNLFLMLGNHSEAMVVTGVHPANQSQGFNINTGDAVNSSQAFEHLELGTNNQMIDGPIVDRFGHTTHAGEGLVITYVTGANVDYTGSQLTPTEANVEANIQFDGLKESTHAIFGVSQLQPLKAATVKITALETGYEPGVEFVDGLLTNDTPVGITRVVVMDAQHHVLEDSNGSVNSASISISFSGGTATVTGINPGNLIAFDTVTAHNRVVIENPGNSHPTLSSSFDVGYFSWGGSQISTLDIGSAVQFEDSAPSADENRVVQLDDDALAGGITGGDGDVTPGTQNTSGTLAHSYGTDGGTMAWLGTGAPAGFVYVVDGNHFFIEQGGNTVVTLTLNTTSGAYTVEKIAPLMHTAGLNENNQTFNVDYQVTDGDGDKAAGQLVITVNDDTPTVGENLMVHLDDDALSGGNPGGAGDTTPDLQNTSGTLAHSYGADGGSMGWLATGAPEGFTYVVDGNQLLVEQGETTVMTLTLNTTTGAYTVEQNAPLVHPEGLNENNQNFDVTYLVTDGDGDTAAGQLAVTVNDDTPTVAENLVIHLDDNALPGGNPVGNEGVPPDIQNTSGTLSHSYGADGGSIAWLTTGAPEGFTYLADGNNLLIRQGDVTVITLSLNTLTGEYLAVQNAAVINAPVPGENSQDFQVGYNVTDGDGDMATGQLAITVKDDTPHGSFNEINLLDDDALPGGNPGGIGDVAPDTAFATGNLDFAFGADGGSIAWLTTGAPDGFTYEADGTSLLVKQAGTLVLTLTLDPVSAAYTVVQNAAIHHVSGLDENNQAFTMNYNVLDNDGDSAIGQFYITVNDDTPAVANNLMIHLDDDALPGGNPGGIGDVAPDVQNTSGTLSHSYGADGGSIAWLTTGAPEGFTYQADGSNLLIRQGDVTVITLSLNTSTGEYLTVQNAAITNVPGLSENNQDFQVGYNVTDGDGDIAIGQLAITVNDDTPVVTQLNDVSFLNTDNPVPGGDSQFSYSMGADKRTSFSNVDSDFSMFSLKGEVGVNSITNTHINWSSEDDTSATFRFDFDYQPNESSPSTAHAMGTLMFNKAEGTYHIILDQYIEGFNIYATSSAMSLTGYEVNSTIVDKSQPLVSVAALSDGAFIQFTGVSEPGGGTVDNNLHASGVDAESNHWAAGELFSQASGWVSVTNLSDGVNGDTMQKGEILNLNLFNYNPHGTLTAAPNAGSSGMFLKFDGIGSTEDLVVVLKLFDTATLQQTTRALIIDNSDILRIGNVLTPDYHIVLDNNDGAVIIENNDFNGNGEHFVMTGAQVLTSTEGITGTALNFNSQTGVTGASTVTQSFGSATTDNDVIKISDIGIMTNQTSTLDSHLEFKFAIKDADLDSTPTQTLNAYIAGSDVNPLETLM